eukprot:g71787.t1
MSGYPKWQIFHFTHNPSPFPTIVSKSQQYNERHSNRAMSTKESGRFHREIRKWRYYAIHAEIIGSHTTCSSTIKIGQVLQYNQASMANKVLNKNKAVSAFQKGHDHVLAQFMGKYKDETLCNWEIRTETRHVPSPSEPGLVTRRLM